MFTFRNQKATKQAKLKCKCGKYFSYRQSLYVRKKGDVLTKHILSKALKVSLD